MSTLSNSIITEKYRPSSFKDIICNEKEKIYKYLNEMDLPSFIFTSCSPGTGKTSVAKLIAKHLDCDSLFLNAADERGIDTIRLLVKEFAQCMSSKEGVKRMVFLDEFESMTPQAQECLKTPMETYSDNVFFILACNNISRILPAIRSRCVTINFDNPNKKEILDRLEYIAAQEDMKYDIEDLHKLLELYYPDIRSMLIALQSGFTIDKIEYENFYKALKRKDLEYIYNKTYNGELNIMGMNDWFFHYLYDNYKEFSYNQIVQISQLLADTEKSWNLSAKLPIIFLANVVKISEIL